MSEDKPEKRGFLKRIFKRVGPDAKEEKGKSAAEQEAYRPEVANVETAESVVTEAELMTEKPEEKEKTDFVPTRKRSSENAEFVVKESEPNLCRQRENWIRIYRNN